LSTLVQALEADKELGLAYSDFQYIDENGTLQQEIIRPPYYPGHFLDGNVVGLCFLWRSLFRKRAGKFDSQFIQSHDYDFYLRLEWACDCRCVHVPKILGYDRNHALTTSRLFGKYEKMTHPEFAQRERIRRGIT
jgi:hypothetical protein